MKGTFYEQLRPCARNGHVVSPPVAKGNSTPLPPRATSDESAPLRMLEHETQAEFLKRLIAYEDGEESRLLQARLAKADRESKRICHALLLMAILFMLSLAGLGYCASLLPQIFLNPTHLVTKSLSALVLASLIAELEFFGYLLWHRRAVSRLQKECQRRILLLVEPQLRSAGVDISEEPSPTLPCNGLQERREDRNGENCSPPAPASEPAAIPECGTGITGIT